MDNVRVFLFLGLALVMMLIYQAWVQDYGPQPVAQAPQATQGVPAADLPAATGLPVAADAPVSSLPPASGDLAIQQVLVSGQPVRVVTDLFDLEINTRGGDIRRVDLRAYPVDIDHPDEPFRLMGDSNGMLFVAQSGLLSPNQGDELPNHHADFRAAQSEYRLAEGQDALSVSLFWEDGAGLTVEKRFTFHRDSYQIDVEFIVDNGSGAPRSIRQYRQLQRTEPSDDESPRFIYTYTGGVIYSREDKYEKISFSDMADEPLSRDFDHGWVAMIQHYFVSAWLPPSDEINHYYTKAVQGGRYIIGMISTAQIIAAGERATLGSRLFVGPKDQQRMKAAAEGLELTVDYGILTVIAQPIYWLMDKIHSLVGNWGWSIILLTMMIKLAFYKLSEASYKSMANMRRMQPRITALKERFGDDKQRMQQAMMEMYKKEKINPLGGCLPILVQIPVFISLYWVLLESVELRQAPFIFWLHDLSKNDPYFVLPVLMGISMFAQQRLNPTPPDPMQAKIMMMLPVVFTFFFLFFPAGLVLYWLVNNLLSITQQWVITRRIEQSHGGG